MTFLLSSKTGFGILLIKQILRQVQDDIYKSAIISTHTYGRERVSLTVERWCLSRSGDGVSPDSHPIPTGFCAWYTPRASPKCYATLTGQFRYLFRNCSLLHNQGLHLQYRYRNTYQLLYLQYLILKLLNSILYS